MASRCQSKSVAAVRRRKCDVARHRRLRGQGCSHLYLIAAETLRHIDRRVRLRNKVFTPYAERIAGGHADAAGQADRLAESVHPYAGYPFQDALSDGIRGRRVGTAQDDDEFLAAVAADDVRLP